MDITTLVDDYVLENEGEVSNDDLAYHFYSLGKKEAINSVWHNASEKPNKAKSILVIDSVDGGMVFSADCLATEHFDEYDIVHWAYLDELLPKSE